MHWEQEILLDLQSFDKEMQETLKNLSMWMFSKKDKNKQIVGVK